MFNLANKITIARILLIPVFMAFLLLKKFQPTGSYIAAAIFGVAALTDTVDGYVARFQKKVTTLGKFLDPVADKLLISAALVALVELKHLSSWVAMIIIAREFAVTGLRLVIAVKGGVIAASPWGKIKTTSQIIAIIVVIINPPIYILSKSLGWYLMAIALILTIVSGIDYFVRTWAILGTPFPTDKSLR